MLKFKFFVDYKSASKWFNENYTHIDLINIQRSNLGFYLYYYELRRGEIDV